jgi:hypothetical protein
MTLDHDWIPAPDRVGGRPSAGTTEIRFQA